MAAEDSQRQEGEESQHLSRVSNLAASIGVKLIIMRAIAALLLLAASSLIRAQTPIVSGLQTVSVHIDSPETYNALLRFFEKDLQWPVLYGKPWTPDRQARRSYAGIWAGNVVLEICGPYAGETFPEGQHARLHGLTYRPFQDTSASVEGLATAGILHKPPFDTTPGGPRFVILDDPALTSPALAVSIMQSGDRQREWTEQDAARAALAAIHGGPVGLLSVKEIVVACPASSGPKWRRFLAAQAPDAGAPALRFVDGPTGALTALVLRVVSASKGNACLKAAGSRKILGSGVQIVCTE
jgi:hypothetical protein